MILEIPAARLGDSRRQDAIRMDLTLKELLVHVNAEVSELDKLAVSSWSVPVSVEEAYLPAPSFIGSHLNHQPSISHIHPVGPGTC